MDDLIERTRQHLDEEHDGEQELLNEFISLRTGLIGAGLAKTKQYANQIDGQVRSLKGDAGKLKRSKTPEDTNDALADLVFSDVPGRVAKALLELADKFGAWHEEGTLVKHDMTQEELAQLVGASRETVNKALADFTQRGWIRVDQREVLLLSVDRLARRAR